MVVCGEGEGPVLDLMSAITTQTDVYQTPGVPFKKKDAIYRNPSGPPVEAAKVPPADFALLPREYVKNTQIHGKYWIIQLKYIII
jgi:hypothetical protein